MCNFQKWKLWFLGKEFQLFLRMTVILTYHESLVYSSPFWNKTCWIMLKLLTRPKRGCTQGPVQAYFECELTICSQRSPRTWLLLPSPQEEPAGCLRLGMVIPSASQYPPAPRSPPASGHQRQPPPSSSWSPLSSLARRTRSGWPPIPQVSVCREQVGREGSETLFFKGRDGLLHGPLPTAIHSTLCAEQTSLACSIFKYQQNYAVPTPKTKQKGDMSECALLTTKHMITNHTIP